MQSDPLKEPSIRFSFVSGHPTKTGSFHLSFPAYRTRATLAWWSEHHLSAIPTFWPLVIYSVYSITKKTPKPRGNMGIAKTSHRWFNRPRPPPLAQPGRVPMSVAGRPLPPRQYLAKPKSATSRAESGRGETTSLGTDLGTDVKLKTTNRTAEFSPCFHLLIGFHFGYLFFGFLSLKTHLHLFSAPSSGYPVF